MSSLQIPRVVSGITVGISSIRRVVRIQIYEFNGQRAAGGCYLGARRNRILQSISDKALARIELKHISKIGRGKGTPSIVPHTQSGRDWQS